MTSGWGVVCRQRTCLRLCGVQVGACNSTAPKTGQEGFRLHYVRCLMRATISPTRPIFSKKTKQKTNTWIEKKPVEGDWTQVTQVLTFKRLFGIFLATELEPLASGEALPRTPQRWLLGVVRSLKSDFTAFYRYHWRKIFVTFYFKRESLFNSFHL